MAEDYAEGGGMHGPEMRDYEPVPAKIKAALARLSELEAAEEPSYCWCCRGTGVAESSQRPGERVPCGRCGGSGHDPAVSTDVSTAEKPVS